MKLKTLIIALSKKNRLFRVSIKKLRNFLNYQAYKKMIKKPLNEKQIIFESFMGRNFSDSPKAIYEYMINNNEFKSYKFIWAFSEPEKYKCLEKSNTTIIKYGSKEYYKSYATSKYWITNSRIPEHIKRKEKQVYVQCWHGTPLKKLGHDIKVEFDNAMNSLKDFVNKYDIDTKRYTHMVSPSKYTTEKYKSAFDLKNVNPDCKIIEKGYPRNDFLYNHNIEDVEKIKSKLNIPSEKKVVLYAPTWRDNQHSSSSGYVYKLNLDLENLYNNLSGEYVMLVRSHYFITNSFDFSKYENFIFDVSSYNDINDLYVISDILITDYSSVFFDYANLKRPIIFYMYDYDEYKYKLRDFYIETNELPGPMIFEEKELVNAIKQHKNIINKHHDIYTIFNNKFNYLDDGNSSKRVVKEILK